MGESHFLAKRWFVSAPQFERIKFQNDSSRVRFGFAPGLNVLLVLTAALEYLP